MTGRENSKPKRSVVCLQLAGIVVHLQGYGVLLMSSLYSYYLAPKSEKGPKWNEQVMPHLYLSH